MQQEELAGVRRRPARSLGALASVNSKRLRGSARVRSGLCDEVCAEGFAVDGGEVCKGELVATYHPGT